MTRDATSRKVVARAFHASKYVTITIELQPEIERGLVARAQARGLTLSDYLAEIVSREANAAEATREKPGTEAKNLFDLFTPVRGLLSDEEIDTLFARNRSTSRPIDLL